jgi:hypothetical protein
MWLGGMHEGWVGLCVLATLLAWLNGRFLTAGVCFFIGLFSKESALIALALLPIVEAIANRRIALRVQLVYLIIPFLVFTGVFWVTAADNTLITHRFYEFGPSAIWVLLNSAHRLMFPWMYLTAAVFAFTARRRPPGVFWGAAAWMIVCLLPYIFLTYQDHVPSRHEHLASMGLCWALAVLLWEIRPIRLAGLCAFLFIAANISYLHWVKDGQFEKRAAPTALLIEELESRRPVRIQLLDFPLNPWIAKMTTRMISGWEPEMIVSDELGETCVGCPKLRWSPEAEEYLWLPP